MNQDDCITKNWYPKKYNEHIFKNEIFGYETPAILFFFPTKHEVWNFLKSMKNRKSEILSVNTTMKRVFPSIIGYVRWFYIVEINIWKHKSRHIYFSIFTSKIQKSHILMIFFMIPCIFEISNISTFRSVVLKI